MRLHPAIQCATGGEASYYFPPGRSMARRVHGERSVGLLYGQRALLIGALEPLTYTGTMLSTSAGDQPFKRLARTAKIQETVFLGTRAEADKALGRGPPPAREDQGRAARGRRRPPRRHRLLGLRPGADALDAGGDRRLGPGDVRDDGAAAERRRARGALAGLRPLRRALRPAARARCPAATASSAPGGTERLASPDLQATEHGAGDGAAGRLRQPVPAPARGNLAPRTTSSRARCRRGCGRSSASAGAAPTSPPSARWPPPTAAPAASSPAGAPRPQRLLLRRRHPGRAAARRHRTPQLALRLSAADLDHTGVGSKSDAQSGRDREAGAARARSGRCTPVPSAVAGRQAARAVGRRARLGEQQPGLAEHPAVAR